MILPEHADLDAMTSLVAGSDKIFNDLSPPNKVLIIQLVNQTKLVGLVDRIDDNLLVITEWFDKSKLWEGEAYVRQ